MGSGCELCLLSLILILILFADRDTTTPSSTTVLEMTIQLEDRPGIPEATPVELSRDPRVLASVGSQTNKYSMGVGGRLQSSR